MTSSVGYRLVSSEGETLGTVESAFRRWQTGDTVVAAGVVYRVRSVIPVEVIAEFIDGPVNGFLEVERL